MEITPCEATHVIQSVNNPQTSDDRDAVEIIEESVLTEDISPDMEVDEKEKDKCREIVTSIRRDEFGIGLEHDLSEQQKQIADKQKDMLGRSLQRLSQELYSKDTHFVLELVQNADDNSYHTHTGKAPPSLKFILSKTCITVLNNETGFIEKNVRAICDVGKSTKDRHCSGYIGQKGIGFKSVFRVTEAPEIHSRGFHIKFDIQSGGPIGYILPQWVEQPYNKEKVDENELIK